MQELMIDIGAAPLEIAPQPHAVETPRDRAPRLSEQLAGIFTEPRALFRRLADTPSWGPAILLLLGLGLLMIVTWAHKVDVDAMQRPILEQNTKLTATQIDQALDVTRRFILPVSIVTLVVRTVFGTMSLALLFWVVGMANAGEKPTYRQALSAATVPNLIGIPYTLLVLVVCMFRSVGGLIPEKLAPSGLAYYLRPSNPKLFALLTQFDPFIIAYFVMIFFALRGTMRMKRIPASVCTAVTVILVAGLKVYFWN
jgi:hypothetical protein